MKHSETANIISAARIPLSLSLLLMSPTGTAFHTVYTLCGLSDIADGCIARRIGTESEFGAKLDSIADTVFVLVCFIKLLPRCNFKAYIWLWIALIAAVKSASIILGYMREKKLVMPHTTANKVTGLLLFAFGLLLFKFDMNCAAIPVCIAASFAAVQELKLQTKHV